ncbi:predicted protein [Postia placenta Mad-698-R]|nr:predicted protein [Postia placenta Mad-698-R]
MFQTLSSFLPSTIQQFGSDKPAPTTEVAPALPRQPPPSDMRPVEEQPVKKKKERTNELVRAPISHERHGSEALLLRELCRPIAVCRCGRCPPDVLLASNTQARKVMCRSQTALIIMACLWASHPQDPIVGACKLVRAIPARPIIELIRIIVCGFGVDEHPIAPASRAAESHPLVHIDDTVPECYETYASFIVVRPPPSKTNHPLNLQVQLVPPNSKERPSSRQSTDSSAEIDAQSLSRTPSNRSDASLYSSYSSAGSISTVGSSSTTSSGRRMIIPLYNLQAHNVMQNVIVDAGTDAKVAKFLKRGLEVIGLAVFEPVEVWGSGAVGVDETGRRVSIDYGRGEPAHTPTSSAVSLNTYEFAHEPSTTPLARVVSPPATPTTSSARSGSRKIFGKLFKRKEGDVGTPPPSPLPLNQSVMPSMATRSKRTSLLSAHGHVLSASVSEPPLQPPVLGIQPSLRSPTVPPKGRPTKYVWIVRKWLKGEPESMFRDVKDRLQEARNGNAAAGLEGVVEEDRTSASKDARTQDGARALKQCISVLHVQDIAGVVILAAEAFRRRVAKGSIARRRPIVDRSGDASRSARTPPQCVDPARASVAAGP